MDDYMERWVCPVCGRPMHRWVSKGQYVDTSTWWFHDDDNTPQCVETGIPEAEF